MRGKIGKVNHHFKGVLAWIETAVVETPIAEAVEDSLVADGMRQGIDVNQADHR